MNHVVLRCHRMGRVSIFANALLSHEKIVKYNFCKVSREPKITLVDVKLSRETKNAL